MASHKNSKGTEAFRLLSFALLAIFFIGVGLFDGPIWCVDTPSYVGMDFSREPVYPLFLIALRNLCDTLKITAQPHGLPAYLTLAVILQSLLWVFSAYHLGFYIYDVTSSLGEKKSRLLAIAAMLSQVAVAVLNRFIANRGSMYSESLMTESLAMPLYVIFTAELVKAFEDYNTKNILKLFFLGVLMASIRKQMLIVLLMWGFTSFIIHLFVKKHRSLRNFSLTVIAVFLALIVITLFDRGYNYAIRGVFASHVGNSKGGLDTVLYTATPEDALLFADADPEKYPEIQALFTKIYNVCDEQQLTIDYAPGYELKEKSNVLNSDWVSLASHYADSYDVIGFDVVLPLCDEYVAEHFPGRDYTHAAIIENEVENYLFKTLLKDRISRIFKGTDRGSLYVFIANIMKAFVISNANISPRILTKVSLVVYVLYLGVFIALFIRNNNAARSRILRLMFIVMAGIAINSVITGSMIFPQPRYMCYGMGLFYLSLLCGILI
jgi:hypothetical protein